MKPSRHPWNTREIAYRLHQIIMNGPKPVRKDIRSFQASSLEIYNQDMQALTPLIEKVLAGLAYMRAPVGVEDGYQALIRAETLAALEWGEAWIKWRTRGNWGSETCGFMDERARL